MAATDRRPMPRPGGRKPARVKGHDMSNAATDAVVFLQAQSLVGGTLTTEQGSGVLIAPDEVLTAAHLLYDSTGQLARTIVVSPGYDRGAVHGVVAADAVHAMPLADWTQLSGTQGDFALVHLATPITDRPTMALGAALAPGSATATGYPLASGGAQASLAETPTKVPGYDVFAGTPLGGTGDSHGSSGGPLWQTVDGVPTVVGLVSSAAGATGYFLDLTAADVAQIQAWEAADHAAPATPLAAAPAVAAPTHASPSAAGADAVADLAGARDLPAIAGRPAMVGALSRVVSLLARDAAARGPEVGFDDLAGGVLAGLGDNGGGRNLAAALLEGVVWGHDGGGVPGAVAGVAAADPGILAFPACERGVRLGALAGQMLLADGH